MNREQYANSKMRAFVLRAFLFEHELHELGEKLRSFRENQAADNDNGE